LKKYIGIDPSITSTAVVVLDEEGNILDQKLIKTKPEKFTCYEERICHILKEISFIKDSTSEMVYLEGISYSSKGQSTFELAGLNFFVRMLLYQNNIKYKCIAPTSVKKFITGNGQCQKNLMLLKVYKKFGIEFTDDNLCDAYSLARFAIDKEK
jgi:crossover junction endodeoxyribonuclease RuvC